VIDNISVTETVATGAGCRKGGWRTLVDKDGTSFPERAGAKVATSRV